MRSIINTFAINTANLTALYLNKSNLHDAVILADHFHNDKFYSLLQVILSLLSALWEVMHRENQSIFLSMLQLWRV